MRYDADHKQQTREKVLDAAAEAIRLDGPHKVSVAQVMQRAGLTHGGFYAHFQSKDELVACAIGHMFDKSALKRIELARDEHAPPQAVASYIDFYLSQAHRDARAWGCAMPALAGDLPRLPVAAQESFASGMRRVTAMLAELLAQSGHTASEDEASSLVAEMVGALSLARAEPDRERSDRMLERSRRALKTRLQLETRT
jgi:TetR/AcrR family transcriptional repressor of nem operon